MGARIANELVGRRAELDRIGAAVAELGRGRGSLLFLSGPPGIGKTRLAAEAVELAVQGGARGVWGRAWEDGDAPPYWPWREVLRGLDRDLPETGAGAAKGRFELLDGIVRALRDAASAAPLVVVLDDLQWADRGSLLALKLLARSLHDVRLLVVGTYRDVEVDLAPETGKLLADTGREGIVLPLQGLTLGDVAELARPVHEGDFTHEAARLHEVTRGNPFFVQEVLRLVDAGAGSLSEDARMPISEGVRGVIRRRLELVPGLARRALEVLSAIGREASVVELCELCDVDPIGLRSALEGAATRHVVVCTADIVAFAHDLVRGCVYEDIELAHRARVHEQIAAMLARHHDADGRAASIARHLLLADPSRVDDIAVAWAERAGRHALCMGAPEAAAAHLGQALAALERRREPPDRRAGEVAIALAHAWHLAARGDLSRAASARAIAIARALGDDALFGRAALSATRGLLIGEAAADAAKLLEEAARRLSGEPALSAQTRARLAGALPLSCPAEDRLRMVRDAVDAARTLGPETLLATLDLARRALKLLDPVEERTAVLVELRDLADARGEHGTAIEARFALAHYAAERGDRQEVVRLALEHADLIRAHPSPTHTIAQHLLASMLATLSGQFDEAMLELEGAERVGRYWGEAEWNGLVVHRINMYVARARRADLPDALRLATELGSEPMTRCVSAMLCALNGDLAAAREHQGRAPPQMFTPAWPLVVRLFVAEMAVAVQDPELATSALEALAPIAHRQIVIIPGAMWNGSMQRLAGSLALLIGRVDEAIERLELAVAENERVGARPWLARSERALAVALERRGRPCDAERVRELDARSRSTFEQLGMDLFLGPSSGGPPPRSERSREAPPRGAVITMTREGDVWRVGWDRAPAVVLVKDSKGLQYLGELVRSPGRELHVTQLADVLETAGDAGPVLDAKAKAAYRARLEDLRDRLEEARRFGDPFRAERIETEIDALAGQLASAVGLGGRDRVIGSHVERARVNVQRRIRSALQRIEEQDGALGRYLAAAVKTGLWCSFSPV